MSNVILGMLSIPYSNAECECTFSLVGKNNIFVLYFLSDNDSVQNLLIAKRNVYLVFVAV